MNDPTIWKAMLLQGGALGMAAILGLVGYFIYKAWLNRRVKPAGGEDQWPEGEVSGMIRPNAAVQTVQGCAAQVAKIENQLSESWRKTSQEIKDMRDGLSSRVGGLHTKMDTITTSMSEMKLEMQNGMFKVKEAARTDGEDRMDKHVNQFKHELK